MAITIPLLDYLLIEAVAALRDSAAVATARAKKLRTKW
jgi:hypothetical protein